MRSPQFVGVFDNRGVGLAKGTGGLLLIFAIPMVNEKASGSVESDGIIAICFVRC